MMRHFSTDCCRRACRQFEVGAILALALLLQAGCNRSDRPPLVEVEGRVTLDGHPLADAWVMFIPDNGLRSSLGKTDARGDYVLIYLRDIHGAVVGTHKAKIFAGDDKSNGGVPSKYNIKTVLTAEVRGGVKNRFNFELNSEAQRP
jgi:hypothetical protein